VNRKRKPLEVLLLAIAIGSGLVVAAELVLIAMGSGSWFPLVGSAVMGIGVTYALVELSRARHQFDQTIQPPSSADE
jgi:CHASE2 domain-containing sensor protein